ncbi:MAG: NINE protein [Bacteroidetes bacterium]|nr:MAG: NINE protein [Bacteroidota bacterium]
MNEEQKKDKNIAAIIAFIPFLGMLGIHHFYLGNGGTGLLYLLFCWFPLTWVAALVDGIQLLTRPQSEFDRRYNPHLYTRQYEQKTLSSHTNNVNVADEIYKLDLLFRKGIITFEEFEKRKAKLLD